MAEPNYRIDRRPRQLLMQQKLTLQRPSPLQLYCSTALLKLPNQSFGVMGLYLQREVNNSAIGTPPVTAGAA